jgi:hypothetical protein
VAQPLDRLGVLAISVSVSLPAVSTGSGCSHSGILSPSKDERMMNTPENRNLPRYKPNPGFRGENDER